MKDILMDPNINAIMMAEFKNKSGLKSKDLLIPYYKLKDYENLLAKAYDK